MYQAELAEAERTLMRAFALYMQALGGPYGELLLKTESLERGGACIVTHDTFVYEVAPSSADSSMAA